MRHARRHAQLLPLDKVPFNEQWRKYDEGGQFAYSVEYGISLERLGFRYEPIPSGEDYGSYKYPLALDKNLFICKDPNRVEYKFVRGFYKPNTKRTLFSSRWVDKTKLLEEFAYRESKLLRVVKIGDFVWCNQEIPRVIHRYLVGGSVPVMFIVKQWR